ncbi:TRAP transporter small permease [Roseibium sp. HPY-6]|uniref:TRAP transporter small permease n=1 Tax=Roseibium sp. HPY-6 TaxID=3229852 RepID=UPI0033903396
MAKNRKKRLLDSAAFLERVIFAVLRYLLVMILATMVVAVLAQVFSRYALDFSLTWSEELARICMITMVFLGAAVLSRDNEHLAVTTIIELLPKRVFHLCVCGAQAVGIYCTWYLANGAWSALLREWAQLTPALQVPFGFIYSVVFFAVAMMIFWLSINLVREALAVTALRDLESTK